MKVSIKKAFNKKRVIALIVMILLILIMIFSNPDFGSFLSKPDTVKLNFQTGVEYDMVTYGKDMLLVNNEGIYAIDKSGREVWSTVSSATSPYVLVNDSYIMLADINGRTIKTFQKEKLAAQIETESEILCAKVNKNGYIAAATDELGYKGVVILFNKNGNEKFRWHSGTGYIGDVDVSKNNKLAVAQLLTDKEHIYSKILLINPDSDKEPVCIAELDGIVMKLKYLEDGSLVALTDNGLYGFKKSGREKFKIPFNGYKPLMCNIDNERNMVIAFDNGLNSTILESYSSNGKKRGSFDGKGEIRTMDVSGECIIAAKHDVIYRLSPSGKVKKEIKANNDIKDIKLFSGRDKLMCLGDSSAELIKIQ